MVHCKLILWRVGRSVSRFLYLFSFMWGFRWYSAICWKDCFCSIVPCLCSFTEGWLTLCGSISILFHWSTCVCCCLFLPVPCCLDYCSFIVSIEVGCCQSFNCVLQYCVGYYGSFASSPYQYRSVCWYSQNNPQRFGFGLHWSYKNLMLRLIFPFSSSKFSN